MKKITILAFILFLSSAITLAAPHKYALICALSTYPAENGWPYIHSTNDVPYMKGALIAQGWKESDIIILIDSQATHERVLATFRSQLIDKARPGDICLFHFSGHGQPVIDKNGDEADGLDEGMICYDTKLNYVAGEYEGEKHFIDDELDVLLTDLRTKLGVNGNAIVVVDACFSGTISKGNDAPTRGTSILMAPPGYKPKSVDSDGEATGFNNLKLSRDESKMAPYVVFSASRHTEPDNEARDENGEFVGPMSYAFSKALIASGPATTWKEFLDKANVWYTEWGLRQKAQIEGYVDNVILGGAAIQQPEHYLVKKINYDNTVVIDGGRLQGIFDSSLVEFYPIGTSNIKDVVPSFKGFIVKANQVESTIQVETEGDLPADAANSWAFVTTQNFGKMKVKVSLEMKDNKELEDAINTEFSKNNIITIVKAGEPADLKVEYAKKQQKLFLTNSYGEKTSTVNAQAGRQDLTIQALTDEIKLFARAKYVRQLSFANRDIDMRLEFVPLKVTGQGDDLAVTGKETEAARTIVGSQLVFHDGDYFTLRITNRGTRPAYYTILDVRPDDTITAICPDINESPEHYMLEAGKSWDFDKILQFGKPYGKEQFVIIASEEILDLRSMATGEGEKHHKSGVSNPMEALMADSMEGKRAKVATIPARSLHVLSREVLVEK